MKRTEEDFPSSGSDWWILGFTVLLVAQFLFGIASEWSTFP